MFKLKGTGIYKSQMHSTKYLISRIIKFPLFQFWHGRRFRSDLLHPHNKKKAEKSEKSTILLRSVGELKVTVTGPSAPPMIRETGKYRVGTHAGGGKPTLMDEWLKTV